MDKSITIITPTYNSEKTVERTLLSVISQNRNDIQYIIVDGQSNDNTLEIVNKYKKYISDIVSEPDDGIADAFNKGIALAKGELVGIINSDDELLKGAIDRLLKTYDGRSDLFCGSIIAKGRRGYQKQHPDTELEKLRYKMTVPHPATFIRREAYLKYGDYDKSYKVAMDRELILRMYLNGARFQFSQDLFALFNCGEGISTVDPRKNNYAEDERISIEYGLSKRSARLYTYKKTAKLAIVKSGRFVIDRLNLWDFINNKTGERMDDTLKNYLFDFDELANEISIK